MFLILKFVPNFMKIYKILVSALMCACTCCTHRHFPLPGKKSCMKPWSSFTASLAMQYIPCNTPWVYCNDRCRFPNFLSMQACNFSFWAEMSVCLLSDVNRFDNRLANCFVSPHDAIKPGMKTPNDRWLHEWLCNAVTRMGVGHPGLDTFSGQQGTSCAVSYADILI